MVSGSEARKPPRPSGGVRVWLRDNLFASRIDTVLTLLCAFVLYKIGAGLFDWAFWNASFSGSDRTACLQENQGACWPFVAAKFEQFIYGRYPLSELWRVNLVFFSGALGLAGLLLPLPLSEHLRRILLLLMLFAYPIFAFTLLTGGAFGLSLVETHRWGGLLVTLVVAVSGITASLPLGVLLALGRRSEITAFRWLSIGFIEFWRGVPLITVLFMASNMLPLLLPDGVSLDKLLRCLIGVALFASAYMAEVVRGGLQAIPRGQYEAARALGLGYWTGMRRVILPQALRLVIPGIVNTFIGLFKDTTLVLIVGLFDLLGIIQLHFGDANWAGPQTYLTGYVFAAAVFFVFCALMSRYSSYMERKLAQDGAKA